MQITRSQWLLALAAAGLAHALLLAVFFLGGLGDPETEQAPEGVMVSLDRLDPGPPPQAAAAEAPTPAPAPQIESASPPPAAEASAPQATGPASPDVPEAVANVGPSPAESDVANASAATPNAAETIETVPAAAPAIEPADAVAIAPINMTESVEPVEQVTAQAPEIAPTQTRETDRSANGAYGDSAESTDDYIVRLRAWLSRHKEYPQAARRNEVEGTVRLYLVIDQNGHIVTKRITQSSGSELLDRAAEQMLARAQPLPAMPSTMQRNRLELVVPIVFSLR